MSLRIGIGNIDLRNTRAFSWRRYWATLISATVENAAPTDVVLTFPTAKPSLGASDFTCTVNGSNVVVNSASWTGAVLTLVLASAIIYGDVIVITFVKTGETVNVTNNVLYSWYGIEIDEANSSPDVTRIADIGKMGYHAALPVHNRIKACLLNDDGTVNYYLDPADWTKKASGAASNLDGTDGQVMIEWPDFYYKVESNYPSAGKHQIKISLSALSGFTKVGKHYMSAYQSALKRTGTVTMASVKNISTDYRGGDNTSAWDAGDNTLLGMPASNFNRTNGRIYARARGTGWNLNGYNDHKWLFWFFAIEYATLNSQKAVNVNLTAEGYKQGGLGNGVSTAASGEWNTFNTYNPFIRCGASDSLANGSGEVSVVKTNFGGAGINRTFTVPRYRGHENPFVHIWNILDGINIEIQSAGTGGESRLWTADSPASWQDNNYTNYTNRGLIGRSNGYMSKALLGAAAEFLPTVATGASNTYYCDYYYTDIPGSGTVLRMLFVGGVAHYGAAAGFAFSDTTLAPSIANANVGSRLRFEAA